MKFLKRLLSDSDKHEILLDSGIETKKNLQLTSSLDKSILEDLRKQWLYPITYHEENDVFIASYPKSGVTWLRHLTADLMYGMRADEVSDVIVNLIFPDVHAYKYYIRTNMPTIFKTHSLPKPEMKKVVNLVRDGRDVMASYHAMLTSQGYDISLTDMISEDRGLFPCGWSEHCEAWLKNPHGAEILRITYEELIQKPLETITKYCEFIGLQCEIDVMERAINAASFDKMREKEITQGWGPKSRNQKSEFVRKGKIGSYKDEIPTDLLEIFIEKSCKQLQVLGYLD